MTVDKKWLYYPNLIAPPQRWVKVDLTQDEDLPDGPCRGLYVGGSGNIKYTDLSGITDTFPTVANGIFPGQFIRIWGTASGTTATGIFAGY